MSRTDHYIFDYVKLILFYAGDTANIRDVIDEIINKDRNIMHYIGFWPRLAATIIDSVILLVITIPLLIAIYGWGYIDDERFIVGTYDFLLSWVFPLVATIAFWFYKQATPGKMVLKLIIVDAKTGGKPSLQQYILRYLGYFISFLALGIGYLWIIWDPKKQGWHDKLAGTVVINPENQQNALGSAPD